MDRMSASPTPDDQVADTEPTAKTGAKAGAKTEIKAATEIAEQIEQKLNPESAKDVAKYIAKIKNTSGIKKMQAWFDNCEEETQRKLMRANDVGVIRKVLEKIPNTPSASDILKNLIIMAARYGVLDVKLEILAESRGISGDLIYKLPEPAVTILMKALGVPELIPLYKVGKKLHSGDKTFAPQVRAEVEKIK